MPKLFPSVLPKRVYPVSLPMHNKSAQRKPANHKKTSRGRISKRGSTIVSKTYNLTQFVTTLNSRRNCLIDLIPKNVTNTDFWSILCSKPLREFRKPKIEIGQKVRILKFDLPFTKGFNPHFTKEVFDNNAISSRKPPTYTKEDEQAEIIRSKIYQNELIKVIQQWNS